MSAQCDAPPPAEWHSGVGLGAGPQEIPETPLARMRRRLAGWVRTMGRSRYAYPALFVGALVESTLLPWPIEFALAGMMLERRSSIPAVATIATLGSVIGGVIFYFIGAQLFETIGQPLVERAGLQEAFEVKRQAFQDYSVWIIFVAAQTPVPFQLTTLAAGVAGVAFWPLLIAALLARGFRYALMAVPLYFFGPALRRWWLGLALWVRRGVLIALLVVFVLALVLPFL